MGIILLYISLKFQQLREYDIGVKMLENLFNETSVSEHIVTNDAFRI